MQVSPTDSGTPQAHPPSYYCSSAPNCSTRQLGGGRGGRRARSVGSSPLLLPLSVIVTTTSSSSRRRLSRVGRRGGEPPPCCGGSERCQRAGHARAASERYGAAGILKPKLPRFLCSVYQRKSKPCPLESSAPTNVSPSSTS